MPAHSERAPIEIGLLKNTGFNAELSITSLNEKYRANIAQGMSPQQAIQKPVEETIGDIKGYGLEYIVRESWLPNPLQVREYKGRRRLFNKFSNLPISEGIDRRERNGGVADALESIEPALLEAPNNSIALMYSDAGESMMPDQSVPEKTIKYPDAQLYFFIKDAEGNYQANTLVMDPLKKEQVERFFASMGYIHRPWATPSISENDRVCELVRDVMYIPGTELTPESIVQKIQRIKNSPVVRTLPNGETRTFDNVYKKMKKGNDLLQVDGLYQQQLDSFKNFVENNKVSLDLKFTQRRIQMELEKTVLNVTRILSGDQPLDHTNLKPLREVFKKQIRTLESSGGCNGGGLSVIQTRLGPRLGGSESDWKYTIGDCITCFKTNKEVGPCSICKDCEKTLPKAS